MIRVFDDVLKDPQSYRCEVLGLEFKTYDFGHCAFHGIAVGGPSDELCDWIKGRFPKLKPILTFFRKSPFGQVEPHYIHTDVDMGNWSALLYLNPEPKEGDGTSFWTHRSTGEFENTVPHLRSEEGKNIEQWTLRGRIEAKWNRLLMFRSSYFHSRAIHENWGDGDGARLLQVVFGTGELT